MMTAEATAMTTVKTRGRNPGSVSIVRRDKGVRVMVTPDVWERLERLAVTVGVPPSTLATVAIGIYVSTQEKSLVLVEKIAERMGDQLGGEMGAEMVKQMSLLTKGPQ